MHEMLTERTRIVPYSEEHIPDIIRMFQEPDSNKFIRPLQGKTPQEWEQRLRSNIFKNQQLLQIWSVYHLENGDFVGTLNLNKFASTDIDQLGLHLTVKYWGQGYGYELCQKILDYAVQVRQLKEVHWIFEAGHTASKNLALKLGFKPFKEMMDEEFGCELYLYKKML
ncbi:MAG: GNAT family N-acetyltransferase [Crocinitomicaceae bacterium]|nr:GNAT family N-acetyltransferase [Crocinitomicaceae bacterium]